MTVDRRYQPYTTAEDKIIARADITIAEICERLQNAGTPRTHSQVSGRRYVLRRGGKSWNPDLGGPPPKAKLTEQQVREIRASGLSQAELAEIYHISRPQVSNIRSGRAWNHVTDEQGDQ